MFRKIPHIKYAFTLALIALFAAGSWAQATKQECEAAENKWVCNLESTDGFCKTAPLTIYEGSEQFGNFNGSAKCIYVTEVASINNLDGGNNASINGVGCGTGNLNGAANCNDLLKEENKVNGGYYVWIINGTITATGGEPTSDDCFCQPVLQLDPEDLVGYGDNDEACNYSSKAQELCNGITWSSVTYTSGEKTAAGCYFVTGANNFGNDITLTINGTECKASNPGGMPLCSDLINQAAKIDGGYYIYMGGSGGNNRFAAVVEHNPIAVCLASFNGDGGSPVPGQVKGPKGGCFPAPEGTPLKPALGFTGWFTEAGIIDFVDNGEEWVFEGEGTCTEVNGDVTLFAHYRDGARVSFDINGGNIADDASNPAAQDILIGEKVDDPGNPEKAGVTFDGWYNGNDKWDFDNNTVTATNITLIAKYTAEVTFNLNGGTGSATAQNVLEGETVEAPVDPTKVGMTFIGWFESTVFGVATDASTAWTFGEGGTPVTGGMELVAGWGYEVTFNTDGGSEAPATQEIIENKTATAPGAPPTKTDLTFGGWWTVINGEGTEWDFATLIDENKDLYAKWLATVTFDPNGGILTSSETAEVTANTAVDEPTDPTREGFTFGGWLNGNTEWNFADPVPTNMTLRAKWMATVTFAETGNSSIQDETVEIGGTVAKPADPTHGIYSTFIGWYDEEDNLFDFSAPITENITLTAKWGWTVTFDSKGGNYAPEAQKLIDNAVPEKPIDPTKDGLTFAGWFKAGQIEAVDFDGDDGVTTNLLLTAKWNATVTFASAGTTTPSVPSLEATIEEGEDVTISDVIARTDKELTFAGWFDNKGNEWTVGDHQVDFDTTLTAKWNATITFTPPSDGTCGIASAIVYEGEKYSGTVPTCTGANGEFAGWYYNDEPFSFANTNIDENIELIGKWGYKIMLHSNPTTENMDEEIPVADGDVADRPSDPQNTKKLTFADWYTESTFENVFAGWGSSIDGDIDLWAGWNAVVSFANTDNAVPAQTILVGRADSKATEPGIPTKAGLTFDGWDFDFNNIIEEDTVVRAKWKAVVTFVNGATETKEDVLPNGKINEPVDPTNPPKTFMGWFDGDEEWDFENDVTDVNITLTAKWGYEVTFNYDDEGVTPSYVVTVEEGTAATPPADPTKDGYRFGGWDEEFDNIQSNLTVTAQWVKQVTVTFNSDGGSAVAPATVDEGSMVTKPANPTKQNAVFNGWYIGETEFDFNTSITADITLIAKWGAEQVTITFMDEDGTTELGKVTFDKGTAIPVDSIPTPTKEGFSLRGWYIGGQAVNFASSVNASFSVTAKWDISTPILPSFAGSNISIQAKGNNIIVSNLPANAKVEVFNMHGKAVGQTGLSKGLYLVKVNNRVAKVVIK